MEKIFGVNSELIEDKFNDGMIEWIKETSILWIKNMG